MNCKFLVGMSTFITLILMLWAILGISYGNVNYQNINRKRIKRGDRAPPPELGMECLRLAMVSVQEYCPLSLLSSSFTSLNGFPMEH